METALIFIGFAESCREMTIKFRSIFRLFFNQGQIYSVLEKLDRKCIASFKGRR